MDKYTLIGLIVGIIVVAGIGSSGGLQDDSMFINSENVTNDTTQNTTSNDNGGINKTNETTNQSASDEPAFYYL